VRERSLPSIIQYGARAVATVVRSSLAIDQQIVLKDEGKRESTDVGKRGVAQIVIQMESGMSIFRYILQVIRRTVGGGGGRR
jgi:hypothetical protein